MLKKVTLLIPLTFNDGSAVPLGTLDQIENDIYGAFNGWTVVGEVVGAFKRITGEKTVDRSLQVWVVVDEAVLPAMRQMVAEFAALLKQDAMYFEVADHHVEFIPAPRAGEQS